MDITITIPLPPDTVAEVNGLIADLRTAAQKVSALTDKVSALADTVTAEIPQLQSSIQEIADAAKHFKVL